MTTAIQYGLDYDDGYRAGLQKGRDAIVSGAADKLVMKRAETLIAPTKAELARVRRALETALVEVSRTRSPAAFIDHVAELTASITAD